MTPPTYADIVAAAPVVRRYLQPTPLYEWARCSVVHFGADGGGGLHRPHGGQPRSRPVRSGSEVVLA
jgi:hypothetical protein